MGQGPRCPPWLPDLGVPAVGAALSHCPPSQHHIQRGPRSAGGRGGHRRVFGVKEPVLVVDWGGKGARRVLQGQKWRFRSHRCQEIWGGAQNTLQPQRNPGVRVSPPSSAPRDPGTPQREQGPPQPQGYPKTRVSPSTSVRVSHGPTRGTSSVRSQPALPAPPARGASGWTPGAVYRVKSNLGRSPSRIPASVPRFPHTGNTFSGGGRGFQPPPRCPWVPQSHGVMPETPEVRVPPVSPAPAGWGDTETGGCHHNRARNQVPPKICPTRPARPCPRDRPRQHPWVPGFGAPPPGEAGDAEQGARTHPRSSAAPQRPANPETNWGGRGCRWGRDRSAWGSLNHPPRPGTGPALAHGPPQRFRTPLGMGGIGGPPGLPLRIPPKI